MTRGAVTALRDAGISIGTDLQIVTAENLGSPVLTPYADCLTRIGYDPAECIRAALGMIELLIEGGRPTERMTFIPPRPPIRPQ
jgi:DNA-binding LacI/PurR family transcriptional regulator